MSSTPVTLLSSMQVNGDGSEPIVDPLVALGTTDPKDVLAHHAKTFNFASHFLPKEQRHNAARLYAWCRHIDDIADEGKHPGEALSIIRQQISDDDDYGPDGVTSDFIRLAREVGLSKRAALDLIDGVESDLSEVLFKTTEELMAYCYRVAGTVGLLMSPMIGVKDPRALPYAIDLGLAMQCSNIARDVLEDAERGRIYLPSDWLQENSWTDISARDIELKRSRVLDPVRKATQRLVDTAEVFYTSANVGLNFIPHRPRLAITVAARLYRHIGSQLVNTKTRWEEGRTVVSAPTKIRVTLFDAIPHFLYGKGIATLDHDSRLHDQIRDLIKPALDEATEQLLARNAANALSRTPGVSANG